MSSRGLTFTMRLSRSEAKAFDELAADRGMSRSELVRSLIKAHHRWMGTIDAEFEDDDTAGGNPIRSHDP